MTTTNRMTRKEYRQEKEHGAVLRTISAAGAVAVGSAVVTLCVALPILLGASYLERKAYDHMDAKRADAFKDQMRLLTEAVEEITPQIELNEGRG